MPTPVPLSIPGAVSVLTDLGLFGVIALGAVVFFASLLYRRFRK